MPKTPMLDDLDSKVNQYRATESTNRKVVQRYHYGILRLAGLGSMQAMIASHWSREKLQKLLTEIAPTP